MGIIVNGNENIIQDNTIEDSSGSGIDVSGAVDTQILNNKVLSVAPVLINNSNLSQKGMSIGSTERTIIKGNIVDGHAAGILVSFSNSVEIDGNTITNNSDPEFGLGGGLILIGNTGTVITNNVVEDNFTSCNSGRCEGDYCSGECPIVEPIIPNTGTILDGNIFDTDPEA